MTGFNSLVQGMAVLKLKHLCSPALTYPYRKILKVLCYWQGRKPGNHLSFRARMTFYPFFQSCNHFTFLIKYWFLNDDNFHSIRKAKMQLYYNKTHTVRLWKKRMMKESIVNCTQRRQQEKMVQNYYSARVFLCYLY